MELSRLGRRAIWLGVALLAAAAILGNTIILLVDVCLGLVLAAEGIRFHRTLQIAERSLRLQNNPTLTPVTVKAGQPLNTTCTITNASDLNFTIERLNFDLPVELDQTFRYGEIQLQSHATKGIELSLLPKTAGRYALGRANFNLRSKLGLFTGVVRVPTRISVIATPELRPGKITIRPEVLETISSDPIRRGPGTDLAGLRPFRYSDNVRDINWRATARTGGLIANESYLERDPPILLLMDVSCLRSTLDEVTKLLAAPELSASPLGLILYDEKKVVARVEPTVGVNNRKTVLRTIVERIGPQVANSKPTISVTGRPYHSLARERLSLENAQFNRGLHPITEKLGALADFILPFLRSAESKHLQRLRAQPVFMAFESASQLRERALILAVSGSLSDLGGMFEGAAYANRTGHEVVVAILDSKLWSVARESVPEGITLLTCAPDELLESLDHAILTMSRRRLNATALETAAASYGIQPPGSTWKSTYPRDQ